MLLSQRPTASATIRGSEEYPRINGSIRFYQTRAGTIVMVQVAGLPEAPKDCESSIFGFHIHEGEQCSGNADDPFSDTMNHYTLGNCPHPYHAGDMPPLFGTHGNAFLAFLTDRFSVLDVIGRTAVIHAMSDNFTTQPSGDSGMKIACGKIMASR